MFFIRRGFRYIEVHHSADIFFLKARVSKQPENEANAFLANIKKQPHNNKTTQQGALFDRLICGSWFGIGLCEACLIQSKT